MLLAKKWITKKDFLSRDGEEVVWWCWPSKPRRSPDIHPKKGGVWMGGWGEECHCL